MRRGNKGERGEPEDQETKMPRGQREKGTAGEPAAQPTLGLESSGKGAGYVM